MRGDALRLGRIGRAHGLAGEVHVQLDWQQSQGLEQAASVVLERAGEAPRRLRVVACRAASKGYLVRFEGVATRSAAEALQGCAVFAERTELPPLEPGEYYLSDAVGLQVCVAGEVLGVVEGVGVYPSVDVVEIRTADGRLLEQPLVEPWVVAVDVGRGRLELSSCDGLIDVRAVSQGGEQSTASVKPQASRKGARWRSGRGRQVLSGNDGGGSSGGSAP